MGMGHPSMLLSEYPVPCLDSLLYGFVESVQISKILSILSVSEDYNVPLSLHGNGHVLEPAYSHE